jgi:hypothetical protein
VKASASRTRSSLRAALIFESLFLMAACGSSAASTATPTVSTSSPTPSRSVTATPTVAATAPGIPSSATPEVSETSVTAAQSIAVAKGLFPLAQGQYAECDQGFDQIAACPFDTRLRQQIAVYAANYARQCPSGCGGAYPLLRQQCGPFPHEQVLPGANAFSAVVTLTGNTCLGAAWTMDVTVVIEGGRPLADDVYCNADDRQYGMYDADPDATGGLPCAPVAG